MYVISKPFNGQAISILDDEGKVALTSTIHNNGQATWPLRTTPSLRRYSVVIPAG